MGVGVRFVTTNKVTLKVHLKVKLKGHIDSKGLSALFFTCHPSFRTRILKLQGDQNNHYLQSPTIQTF